MAELFLRAGIIAKTRPRIFRSIDIDIEKICGDPDIDTVDIGLPPLLHSKPAMLAAEEDKGVLCEKPLARNGEEAQGMVGAVQKHGVFNGYLENYSFFPWTEEAKRCLENRSIHRWWVHL